MNAQVSHIMNKRVKFTSGPKRTPYEGVVMSFNGKHVVVRSDSGVERKVFPGCCTVI